VTIALPEDGRKIVWEPTPKQAEFLQADEYEVLYGGAAGGGKSDALLIDAWCLQHGGPSNPNHRAIIFRRSCPDLADLIDRGNALFPQFIEGVTYNANERCWETPAGAKLYLGHLHHDKHRFNHRGRAYNYIGFDELTLWPSDVCWVYLQSRNRTTDRTLPCYMRATTNPDGPGQTWVMERWAIEESGKETQVEAIVDAEVQDDAGKWVLVPRAFIRRFIPAKLAENPHLRGTGYRERLMLLPPDEREALLEGLWRGNRVEGSYYFQQLQKARAEGRIAKVPFTPGIPVNTFWDLGLNDNNAIWFHQQVGLTNRFIHAYQNSGETLDHYAAYLQEMARERGYVYGSHYLPHDGAHRSRQTGKTDLQILSEQLPGEDFEIVERVKKVLTGINQTRAAFLSCYFDAEECRDGLASLAAYRKRWNNATNSYTHEPVHDDHSNYADAFRQFGQGFEGAQVHITASDPEWKKKLAERFRANARRNPMTA
jgi:hypothetical protein